MELTNHIQESNSKTFTTCNGKINTNGICDKCCQPAQITSSFCGRLIEVFPTKEVLELPKETIERKHTPLPWIVRSLKNEYHEGCFVECEKETINKPYGQEILGDDYHEGLSKEEDAKFIVEACNAYYELQDRLKIKHQVNVDFRIQLESAKSEALRSLSEIEKLKEALNEVIKCLESGTISFPATRIDLINKIESLLKSLPNKEA